MIEIKHRETGAIIVHDEAASTVREAVELICPIHGDA